MLNLKQKSAIRRNVDIELGIKPPYSSIYTNKKKYTRKEKLLVELEVENELNCLSFLLFPDVDLKLLKRIRPLLLIAHCHLRFHLPVLEFLDSLQQGK